VGNHQLQANYPGDNSFGSSTSAGSTTSPFSFTVTKAKSFIADFFPVGTAVANVPLNLAGQIGLTNYCAPFGGTMTATDLSSGTPITLGTGALTSLYCDSYSFPVTFTTPGITDPQCPTGVACRHIVRIDYSGDANVIGATKTFPFIFVYPNAASSTFLSADTITAMVGSPVNLTAGVMTPVANHQPTGQLVTFLDGATVLGTAPLSNPVDNGGGAFVLSAQLTLNALSGGPHNLVAKYAGDSVLTGSDSSSTPVLVTMMDYSFQGAPSSLTIKNGQSGTATVSVFPLGGFAQAVQLSCGNLPTNLTCTFSPASVTPDGIHPANAALTISTTHMVAKQFGSGRLWAISSTFALGFVLLPFGTRRRLKTGLVVLCLFTVALAAAGCGSSGSNSTSGAVGTYNITITATSAGVPNAKTAQVTVNVVR
jgi:hypothetical protein